MAEEMKYLIKLQITNFEYEAGYWTNICNNLLSVECLPDIKVIYTVKEHQQYILYEDGNMTFRNKSFAQNCI